MQPTDDSALLRQYIEDESDEAFASLVTRYINLVYSVALRQIGNPHQAEEITQAVFVILAKKAVELRHDKALSSWLFRTTRLTTNNFLRSEIRRARREQEAYMQSTFNETDNGIWERIAPLLDTAVASLGEKDRRAIILRFYEGRNLREVGVALGANEEAAKKRVNRAVEKLQSFFVKRGVTSTTAAMIGAISASSVQAAPVALAKTTTAVAVAKGATASGSTLTLIQGALKVMAWSKAKTAIGVGMAFILAAGTTGIVVAQAGKSGNSPSKKLNGDVAVDRTTPRGTMFVMANAMENGDAKSYLESFDFATGGELKSSLEAFVAAMARFNRAISNKFGADAAHAVFPNLPFVIPTNMIPSLEEKVQGDTATVSMSAGGKGGRPVRFTKIGGEWKMAADGFVHLSPAVQKDLYARVIKAMDQTSPEITQGKFQTADEVVEKMKERAR